MMLQRSGTLKLQAASASTYCAGIGSAEVENTRRQNVDRKWYLRELKYMLHAVQPTSHLVRSGLSTECTHTNLCMCMRVCIYIYTYMPLQRLYMSASFPS